MAQGKVILYDLPARDGLAWSLNPWKTRLALNFKGIPYETQWVEYPDIEPLFKSFGVKGNPGQAKPYTIPTVRFADDKVVMDSLAIIAEIEARDPEPTLRADDPMAQRSQDLVGEVMGALRAVVLPAIPVKLLNESSAEYFFRTRAEGFGMTLAEFEKTKGGEPAWEASKSVFAKATALLRENDGPFFLGETVSYADFIYVGLLHFIGRSAGKESLQRVFSMSSESETLYKACSQWLERDSY